MTEFEIANTIFDKLLSWQFIILVIFIMFKKQLSHLLNRTQQLEVGNDKFNFKWQFSELQKLNTIVSTTSPQQTQKTKPTEPDSFQQQIERIADISPAAAIPFAYAQLVNKCSRDLVDMNNWQSDQNYINVVMQGLYKNNDIDKNTFAMFNNIKAICFGILYKKGSWDTISRQEAIEYGKSIETFMDIISILQRDE